MNQIFVSCEEGLQEPVWLSKIEDFAANVLEAAGYDGEEISILFCGDPMIKELNANYRNIDAPTDVLSFENGEEYTDEEGKIWFQAGDIAISVDTLPKNAEYFEVSQNEELKRLIIHGILSQGNHFFRSVSNLEKIGCCQIHAPVSCLGRKNNRHKQCVGGCEIQLRKRVWVFFPEPFKKFFYFF